MRDKMPWPALCFIIPLPFLNRVQIELFQRTFEIALKGNKLIFASKFQKEPEKDNFIRNLDFGKDIYKGQDK